MRNSPKSRAKTLPDEIQIRREPPLAVITPVGRLDIAEVTGLISRLLDHPDFEPGLPAVWDLDHVDIGGMGESDARVMATFNSSVRQERGNTRIAIVAASDETYEFALMYGEWVRLAHIEFRAFRVLEEAVEWASVTPASP